MNAYRGRKKNVSARKHSRAYEAASVLDGHKRLRASGSAHACRAILPPRFRCFERSSAIVRIPKKQRNR